MKSYYNYDTKYETFILCQNLIYLAKNQVYLVIDQKLTTKNRLRGSLCKYLRFFSPMQNDEEFPLFDEEVAPIASPDETCIDICNSSVSDAQDEQRSYPAFDATYHSFSVCSDA